MNNYLKSWERRERKYTTKYSVQIARILNAQWNNAAKQYLESSSFEVNDALLKTAYQRLYRQISSAEISIVMQSIKKQKDLISAIANLFEGTLTIRYIKNLMQQYFDVYILQRLLQVSQTTKQQIQQAIQEGIDAGKGPEDIALYIMQKAREINPKRAIRIARTESITAANRAQLLTHEASPFEYEKAWLRVVDDRTRDQHINMDPNNFIDLWDHFEVQAKNGVFDRMIAPGDVEASAGNVVNCRCVLRYRTKKDENGRPIRKRALV